MMQAAKQFKASLPMLEEYLDQAGTFRWGGQTGRGLKNHLKQAARAAADEFARGGKSTGNRQHLKIALEGAGVPENVAFDIAQNS